MKPQWEVFSQFLTGFEFFLKIVDTHDDFIFIKFCRLYKSQWYIFCLKSILNEKNRSFLEQNVHFLSYYTLESIVKPNLLKAQFCAFNTSDSTTIPSTVQNLQTKSWVPDFVGDSSNNLLAIGTVGMPLCPGLHKNVSPAKRTNQIAEIINFLNSTTLCLTRYAASLLVYNTNK